MRISLNLTTMISLIQKLLMGLLFHARANFRPVWFGRCRSFTPYAFHKRGLLLSQKTLFNLSCCPEDGQLVVGFSGIKRGPRIVEDKVNFLTRVPLC